MLETGAQKEEHPLQVNTNTPGVQIVNHGSVVAFHLLSQNAKTFVDENVQTESWQFMGDALCVDHRFASDLAEGMRESGLVLS